MSNCKPKKLSKVYIYRGDTWRRTWLFRSEGTPYDLGAATARLHIRSLDGKLLVDAEVRVFPAEGRIDVRADIPIDAPIDVYTYDLEVTWDDGIVNTYSKSLLEVLEDATYDEA